MRVAIFIILVNCVTATKAELTLEERTWLFKNWLSIDSITHVCGKTRIDLAFPDLGTMVDLMDDTTTYAQAYDNWKKRYCKRAGKLLEKSLYELETSHDAYLFKKTQLENLQRGKR